MQEPICPEFRYASFMVRIWRPAQPEPEGPGGDWLGEIEHLQSGQHLRFETLEEVPELLRRQAEALSTA